MSCCCVCLVSPNGLARFFTRGDSYGMVTVDIFTVGRDEVTRKNERGIVEIICLANKSATLLLWL